MREVALLFDQHGNPIYLREGDSHCYIPDDPKYRWKVMWDNRDRMGGEVHTHPFSDIPVPSPTDVTTWSAIERGLGRRFVWGIAAKFVTLFYVWTGPGLHDYMLVPHIAKDTIQGLLDRSFSEPQPQGGK